MEFLHVQLYQQSRFCHALKFSFSHAGCAGCHALKAAGSEANIGPNLDTVSLTEELVKEMVTYGLGVMPAYGEGILTEEEIDIVSYYVANSAGK